jgi:hypothetical protein
MRRALLVLAAPIRFTPAPASPSALSDNLAGFVQDPILSRDRGRRVV